MVIFHSLECFENQFIALYANNLTKFGNTFVTPDSQQAIVVGKISLQVKSDKASIIFAFLNRCKINSLSKLELVSLEKKP